MFLRSLGRVALAAAILGGLAGEALAQAPAAPGTEGTNVPYIEVFVLKSGPITWFIQIPLSIVVVALVIRYAMLVRRRNLLPDETQQRMVELLKAEQHREAMELAANDPSMLGRLLSAGLHQAPSGFAAMQRAVGEAAEEQSILLLRRIEMLNIIGNISPMIGLFGTVTGMILAFWALVDIVQRGGMTDAAQLAAGIMYALGTTFWGLLVAIPALAAFSWFRGRIESLTDETAAAAEGFLEDFRRAARRQKQTERKTS